MNIGIIAVFFFWFWFFAGLGIVMMVGMLRGIFVQRFV